MRDIKDFNLEDLVQYIKETDDLKELKEYLSKYHHYELAELFKELSEYDLLKVHAIYSNEEIGEILSYIDSDDAVSIIEDLNDSKIAEIINTMEPDDAIDIIQEFDEDKQEIIINLLDEDQKHDMYELGIYKDDSAGAIMNSNYISIISGSDVKQIMKEIVAKAPDVETITTSFVVDSSGVLLGTLDLKKVIVTKSPMQVNQIMNSNFKYVEVNDTLDHTTSLIKKYDVYVLPVLEDGVLKGIITMDDALDTFYEESEDDFVKFAAVSESLEADERILLSVKNRLPWLVLLLILNLFIAVVISRFDYIIEVQALTLLVIFQPVILDLAGNCGTQSLGITISEISKNEMTTRNKVLAHITKEFLLGLANGIVLAIVGILIAYIVSKTTKSGLEFIDVAIVLSISIVISSTSANVFGTVIPLFFYKIKIDPAAASGPLITTLIDILTILIYYALVTVLIYSKLNL